MDASSQPVLPAVSLLYAWTKPGLWNQMDLGSILE